MTSETGNVDTGSELLAHFGRHLAHELNNPIGAISSAIYLIEDFVASATDGSLPAEQIRPFVESIREECDRLRDIVQEFVKFVTTDSVLALPMDLTEFLDARAKEMAREGLSVTFEGSGQGPVGVLGDARTLGVVLRLLGGDAVAHNAKQVLLGRIDVNAQKCSFHIRDDRAQLPSDETALAAFEIDFRRRGIGLGLRLPLVKKIIELHNGSIEARSDRGEMDICIELPLTSIDQH